MVEVLHAPHPEGLGLLLVVGGEHSAAQHTTRLRLCVHRRSSGVGCSRGRLRAHALHSLTLPSDMVCARWIVCCGGRERSTAAPAAGARTARAPAAHPSVTARRWCSPPCTMSRHGRSAWRASHTPARSRDRPPGTRLCTHRAPYIPLFAACVAKRHGKKRRGQNCFCASGRVKGQKGGGGWLWAGRADARWHWAWLG